MNILWVGFRLFLFWFALVHAAAAYVYLKLGMRGGLIMEIVGISLISFLALPALKRYQAYFNNHGFSLLQIFLVMALIHVALYIFAAYI